MPLKVKAVSISMQNARYFSAWSCLNQKSLYDTLGVTPSATQADVKSAFYKLSKKHHPDTNVSDSSSTAKFQEIVEAYEILGNEAARKRYDKGMPIAHGKMSPSPSGFKAPEDPQAAFYKSRLMNKMNAASTARTYNFDAWTSEHYSSSLRSNRNLKTELNDRRFSQRAKIPGQEQKTESSFAIIFCSCILAAYIFLRVYTNDDVPRSRK